MFSAVRNTIVDALLDQCPTESTVSVLRLIDQDGKTVNPESKEQLETEALTDFDKRDIELRYSNVSVHIHENTAANGGIKSVNQSIALSLREVALDRDYGWLEFKNVPLETSVAILALLHEAQDFETLPPTVLDSILEEVRDKNIAIESNFGSNRTAILHRYEEQLKRTVNPKDLERAERIPPIKILEIKPDGSGTRINWDEKTTYTGTPALTWAPVASVNAAQGEPQTTKRDAVTWIDIEAPTPQKLKAISDKFGIPERILREALREDHGTGIIKSRDSITIYTRLLEIGDSDEKKSSRSKLQLGTPDSLSLVVHGNCIVTLHARPITAMSDTRRKFETGDTPIESHDGTGSVLSEILEECAKENNSKLEFLEESLMKYGDAIEHRLVGLNELSALYALRKSFKAARELLKKEENIPAALELNVNLFNEVEAESACQGYRSRLETARDKANTLFDDSNDFVARNGNRLSARAATGALAALFVALSQGYVQSLADGAFEPTRGLAGTILGLGIFGAVVAAGRAVRRGQW